MSPTVTALDATLGAVVEDISLAQLDDRQFTDLVDLFHTYGVLVFPRQHLAPDDQVAFSQRLGALENVGTESSPHIKDISNLRRDGTVVTDPDNPSMKIMLGNMGWHSDSSFRTPPAKASVLSCQIAPPDGGETDFADMRAAADSLDDAMRGHLDGRLVTHSYLYSQGAVGGLDANFTAEQRAKMGPAQHPVLREHPATGRPSLFIGRHAYQLSGLPDDEAKALLDELLEWACQPPRTFRHRWTAGDTVMWDNRCVLHRARPWDYRHARLMWHTRVAGDAT